MKDKIVKPEDIDLEKWFEHFKNKTGQEQVLHHLKQLKAQMGKLINKTDADTEMTVPWNAAVSTCMCTVDKKIAKIQGKAVKK